MIKHGVTGYWPVIFVLWTQFWPRPHLAEIHRYRATFSSQSFKTGTIPTVPILTTDSRDLSYNLDTQGSTQNPKPYNYPLWPQFSHTLTNLFVIESYQSTTQPISFDLYSYMPTTRAYPVSPTSDNPRRWASLVPPTRNATTPTLNPNSQSDSFLFDYVFRQLMPRNPTIPAIPLIRKIPNPRIRKPLWMPSTTRVINDQSPSPHNHSEPLRLSTIPFQDRCICSQNSFEVNSLLNTHPFTPGAPTAPQHYSFYFQGIFPNKFPVGYQASEIYSSFGLPAYSRTTCLNRKTAAIMAANQSDDTSTPRDWLDPFLLFYPQRTPTTRTNMNSEQTSVTKTAELPETEMSDATSSPPTIDNLLNPLLIETEPLAYLESLVPGNAFASLNYTASALIPPLVLPVIPSSVSTALIKELRAGQRTLDTSILSDLTLRASENATATEECASDLVKYKEHLALQQQQIPPLIAELSSLTAQS